MEISTTLKCVYTYITIHHTINFEWAEGTQVWCFLFSFTQSIPFNQHPKEKVKSGGWRLCLFICQKERKKVKKKEKKERKGKERKKKRNEKRKGRKKPSLFLVSNEILFHKTAGKAPYHALSLQGLHDSDLISPCFLRALTETQRRCVGVVLFFVFSFLFLRVVHSTSPSLRCPSGLYHQRAVALPQSGYHEITTYALHYSGGDSPPCLEWNSGFQVRCDALSVSWASMNSLIKLL